MLEIIDKNSWQTLFLCALVVSVIPSLIIVVKRHIVNRLDCLYKKGISYSVYIWHIDKKINVGKTTYVFNEKLREVSPPMKYSEATAQKKRLRKEYLRFAKEAKEEGKTADYYKFICWARSLTLCEITKTETENSRNFLR